MIGSVASCLRCKGQAIKDVSPEDRLPCTDILLLTFSRRAAVEMTGRVKRITAAALGTGDIDLPWAGTFHAVGARLLREYAHRIGLQPSFTILDRSDAADLMNLVRHGLDLSKKESRFPKKDTCPAIYSLVINSGASLKTVLRARFPWCVDWKKELRKLFAAYAAAKQQQNVLDYDDLLSYWAEMMSDLGEVEARLNAILLEVRCSSGKVILLIDDMHELTGGDNRANTDATSTLKAALDDGRVWYCGGCPSAPGATCSRSCAKGR